MTAWFAILWRLALTALVATVIARAFVDALDIVVIVVRHRRTR